MPTKLTLRIDRELIKSVKDYSKKRGKSVSKIVADLFELIRMEEKGRKQELPPSVRALKGILKDAGVDEQDYKKHLEEKYL